MANGKNILITGASRGIGLLTAQALAARGHRVFAGMRDLNGRNAGVAEDLGNWAAQGGHAVVPCDLDVTNPLSIRETVDEIEAKTPLDVLINNAGIMPVGLTEAFTTDQFRALMEVNVFGLAEVSRAVLPGMRARQDGLLVHLSSSAGRLAIPYFGLYCASKWAVEAYAESLHYELEPFGVQSVIVEPSGHATDLVETSPLPDDAARLESYGEAAKGGEKLQQMFRDLFAQGAASNDARNVADRIVGLVEAEGPRPLRTQVGDDMGVGGINNATAPLQSGLIDQLRPVYSAR